MSAPIQLGEKILFGKELKELIQQSERRIALIADDRVMDLYGKKLERLLHAEEIDLVSFTFPAGELSKTRQTKERIEDELFQAGFNRETMILALGGGVTLDIAGFIASTFCRGVPFISCPTTLLAMADAAIGGKTSVNTPFGKNLVGTIYHPEMILIDTSLLNTLPLKEIRNGVVEMIKHGAVADVGYFKIFEEKLDRIHALQSDVLIDVIERSCRIKQQITREDEKEMGKRRLLNFGHTIGHAIEKVTHFSTTHGEAVALGMMAEAHIAIEQGYLDRISFERLQQVLTMNHPELALPSHITSEKLFQVMMMDKKCKGSVPRVVMLSSLGHPLDCEGQWCVAVSEESLKKTLEWLCHALHSYQRA